MILGRSGHHCINLRKFKANLMSFTKPKSNPFYRVTLWIFRGKETQIWNTCEAWPWSFTSAYTFAPASLLECIFFQL